MHDLLERIRAHYLEQFLVFLSSQREAQPVGAGEVKLQLADTSSLFRHLYCVDFISGGEELRTTEMQPNSILQFDAVASSLAGMAVELESLCWDSAEFSVDRLPLNADHFDNWFQHWFDPEEKKLDHSAELSGNIHSLLVDKNTVSVDFGTAPVKAFIDLLNALNECGVKKVIVRNPRDQT